MGSYKEVEGNIIHLANESKFDVVVQGNNCFCTQGAGLAPQFVKAFSSDKFQMEAPEHRGDINKLGTIDYERQYYERQGKDNFKWVKYPDDDGRWCKHSMTIVNAYTQYNYGGNHSDGDLRPVDYEAITLVMRKMNKIFKGLEIGLPLIGCGLAGGDWVIVKEIIQKELKDCNITVVKFKK